jgi:hypothetical protein
MKDLFILVLGALVSTVGMLALRWLRKDHVSEEISRKTQVLDLRERMQRQGVTAAELH